jgi:GTPase
MFEDRIKVKVSAGKGGNGIVAWRRLKYIPKGGPWGGNGGIGGDVIVKVDPNEFSLESLRHSRFLRAENGRDGGPNLRRGRGGKNLVVKVPPGTLVIDSETREVLHDLTEEGQECLLTKGGVGGRGNASFKSATNRAPVKCTLGLPGEERNIELELKLIADVGLVGWPNAGKSTLISRLTSTKVKIAAYPFTTLRPNLGFVEFDDYSRVLIADIPGIIEGASDNRGLGIEFLRHIERTKVLIYVIDLASVDDRDPIEDFKILLSEVNSYCTDEIKKPSFVLLNKIDLLGDTSEEDAFRAAFPDLSDITYTVSCLEDLGISPFRKALKELVQRDGKRF